MPVTRARPNAQTLLTSNAGDAFSTVLNDLRERALSFPPKTFGFYEYSAEQFAKVTDRKAWAQANPAMGYTITEEAIEESVATSAIETTRTETLCTWISSLVSPWPYMSVEESGDKTLELNPGPLTIFGFDVSPSRRDASLSMGQILPDGRIGVAVLEVFHNDVAVDDLYIAQRIKHWTNIYYPRTVCYDKYTTATIAKRLEMSGVAVQDISGMVAYQAAGDLYNALVNKKLVHSGQNELVESMANCAAKVSDASWRIVRRKSAGPVDVAISLSFIIHILNQPVGEAKVYS
jgi:phage terminase large subunit-like protein